MNPNKLIASTSACFIKGLLLHLRGFFCLLNSRPDMEND